MLCRPTPGAAAGPGTRVRPVGCIAPDWNRYLDSSCDGERLRIDPCVPRWWREFEITYRRGRTTYRIKVENPLGISSGVLSVALDGQELDHEEILLIDDNQPHQIRVVLGEKPKKIETPMAESETSEEQASSS